jgi:hypothetical protein
MMTEEPGTAILFRQLTNPPPPVGHLVDDDVPEVLWQVEFWEPCALPGFGRGFPSAVAWVRAWATDDPESTSIAADLLFILVEDSARRNGIATKLLTACDAKWEDFCVGRAAISEHGEAFLKKWYQSRRNR